MDNKRIVVTGLGVVSCFGNDVDLFYDRLKSGESGVSMIDSFSTEGFATQFAASIKDFDSTGFLSPKQARRVDNYIAYSIVAGKKALQDAQVNDDTIDAIDKTRVGVIIGSGMGGMSVFSDGVQTLLEKGARRVSPFFVPYIITNMGGALLAMDYGFMGPNYSVSTACATGNYAIISAANHLKNGDADMIVCGGVEASISPIGVAGFCSCKALSERNDEPTKASRPWDKGRDGFVIGEGAGVVVLETLEHAEKRGAPILAEYLGGAFSCDAYHMTEPRQDGKGIAMCINKSLEQAGLQSRDVNYINAHATSTPAGDMAEIGALNQVFDNRSEIAINATKSMIGHSLGAAAGIEAVVCVKALQEQKLHPTINLEDPEPLDFHVPTEAIDFPVNVALSNCLGFGGHNAAILLGRVDR